MSRVDELLKTKDLITIARDFEAALTEICDRYQHNVAPTVFTLDDAYEIARKALNPTAPRFTLLASQIAAIMPNLPVLKLTTYLPYLGAAMDKYEINTPLRAAAFLAQLAHESGEFRWMEEIWGPTDAQKRYEGRADLGNTEPGDGKRFKGRGPIQITGRDNYKKYGELLGVDLIANPDLAAKPEYAFQIAGAYWKENRLNEIADQGTYAAFIVITRKINGGTNGLAERERYYAAAKKALGVE